VPHMADPNVAIVGKAGVGLTAGQDLHLSAQDTAQIASGQDTHWAVGGQVRVQTGQAIGVLAGAIQPGSEAAGKGLSIIAAQGPIEMQAQAGAAQIAAKGALELKTANGVVNIAAAKKVVLAVSGGASITIEGGSFTAQCPGKITVQAGQKSMVGPERMELVLPILPRSDALAAASFNQFFILRWANSGKPMKNQAFRIRRANGQLQSGTTDDQGRSPLLDTATQAERLSVEILRSAIQS